MRDSELGVRNVQDRAILKLLMDGIDADKSG
jgi:hypothetical protein